MTSRPVSHRARTGALLHAVLDGFGEGVQGGRAGDHDAEVGFDDGPEVDFVGPPGCVVVLVVEADDEEEAEDAGYADAVEGGC